MAGTRAVLSGGPLLRRTCTPPTPLNTPRGVLGFQATQRLILCRILAPCLQRKCDAYWEAQRERRWAKEVENFRNIDNSELRVGIMGLGE